MSIGYVDDPAPDVTELRISPADQRWSIVIGAFAGLAVGLLLPLIWRFLADLEWIPFHGPLEFIMSMKVTGVAIVRPIGLATVGAGALAVWAFSQPSLTISDAEVVVRKGDTRRVIRRDQVAGVYLSKGSTVVIESAEGRKLFDDEIEGAKKTAGPAFTSHGYPWEGQPVISPSHRPLDQQDVIDRGGHRHDQPDKPQ